MNRARARLAFGLGLPCGARAHASESWAALAGSIDPGVVLLLIVAATLYAGGTLRLWRHAGTGRGIRMRDAIAFTAGWLALVTALLSPLDAWGSRLFSAHMVQHELLMLIAAPALVLGRPLAAWIWGFGPAQRQALGHAVRTPGWRACWRWFSSPLAAWTLHAAALWLWHVPALFEASLRTEGWHVLQHASFLGTALLFWWAVLGRDVRSAPAAGTALPALFTTMLHTGVLGALLTFSPQLWYPSYAQHAGAFGLDPVQDQQLGGLVMWVPGSLAYLLGALVVVGRVLVSPPTATATNDGRPRSAAP